MVPLNTLFEISRRLRAREDVPILDSTESPTFDAAWNIYTCMAARDPSFYTAVWSAALAYVFTQDSNGPFNIKTVKEASNFVAMSYISGAHNVSGLLETVARDELKAGSQQQISAKIRFIEIVAAKVTQNLIAHSNAAIAKGNALDNDMKLVLGEFYSLCIYSLRELRANAYQSFRMDASESVLDHTATMQMFGLPLFMNRDERARNEHLKQHVGDDLVALPTRPGIAIEKVIRQGNTDEEGATIIAFGQIKKRAPRPAP